MDNISKKLSVLMLVAIFLFSSSIIPAAEAKIIETSFFIDQQSSSARSELQSFLSREDVKTRLIEFGVNPEDALSRVAALTDQEVIEFQTHINELPAGSGVFALLGMVLVVLIVLELVGVTNVFNHI